MVSTFAGILFSPFRLILVEIKEGPPVEALDGSGSYAVAAAGLVLSLNR